MRLVRVAIDGVDHVGILEGDEIRVADPWARFLLGGGPLGADRLTTKQTIAASEATLRAPVTPSKGVGIGLNYLSHAQEAQLPDVPENPMLFSILPTSFTGPDATVSLPVIGEKFDYEAELAVVIGKRAHRVQAQDAMDHVFGYTCANDLSIREWQMQNNWTFGKSADGFTPVGPCVVTDDEITDPYDLRMTMTVNGEIRQDERTQMVNRIPYLIEFVTAAVTLEPGDVILTGTPAGVGFFEQNWLKKGDVVEVEIERIGRLTTTLV